MCTNKYNIVFSREKLGLDDSGTRVRYHFQKGDIDESTFLSKTIITKCNVIGFVECSTSFHIMFRSEYHLSSIFMLGNNEAEARLLFYLIRPDFGYRIISTNPIESHRVTMLEEDE